MATYRRVIKLLLVALCLGASSTSWAQTPTFTPTTTQPSCQFSFGKVSGGFKADTSGQIVASKFTAPYGGVVDFIYCNAPQTGQVRLGIYTDVGGVPGTLVAQTGVSTVTNGGNWFYDIAGTVFPAGTYWLAFTASGGAQLSYDTGVAGCEYYSTFAGGTFPTTFPAGTVGNRSWGIDVYFNNCGTATPTLTGTPTTNGTPVLKSCLKVDDLEDGDYTSLLAGYWAGGSAGSCNSSLSNVTGGANGTNRSMQIVGTCPIMGDGQGWSIGVQTAPPTGYLDASLNFIDLSFWVRASVPYTARLQLNNTSTTSSAYAQWGSTFTAGTTWQKITIPRSAFDQPVTAPYVALDVILSGLQSISWKNQGASPSPVTLWVDEICLGMGSLPTYTPTDSPTFTETYTGTWFSPSPTLTPTVTRTPTFTNTRTRTSIYTGTPTNTCVGPCPTDTFTFTYTETHTPTISFTPTDSSTPSSTPTGTWYTSTPTWTGTLTRTHTRTFTTTSTFTRTRTPQYSSTPTNTCVGPCPTDTFTFTYTETQTPTISFTPTDSSTPSSTPTGTWYTSTPTRTGTLTNTRTRTFTTTSTFTRTRTPQYSSTPTNTCVGPCPTDTFTFTPSETLTFTETATPSPTPSGTWMTSTRTATHTHTNTWTNTFTITRTPPILTYTVTSTWTPTDTTTPTPSPTSGLIDHQVVGVDPASALTFPLTDGTQLLIPANAWPVSVTLTVDLYDAAAAPTGAPYYQFLDTAFTVDTGGVPLSGSVTIVLTYDPTDIPVGYTESDLVIVYNDGSAWTEVPVVLDTANHTLTVVTDHFSWWAVAVQSIHLTPLITPTYTGTPYSGATATRTLTMTKTPSPQRTMTLTPTVYAGGTVTPVPGVVQGVSSVRPYPNPLREGSNVRLYFETLGAGGTVDASAKARMRVFTAAGHKIWETSVTGASLGANVVDWNALDLKGAPLGNGLYYVTVTVESGGKTFTRSAPLLILR